MEWGINQVRELLIGAMRQGPIPQHVAFVMDGNRRFAKNHKIEKVEGHNLGFEALARVCTHFQPHTELKLIQSRFLKSVISLESRWLRFTLSA